MPGTLADRLLDLAAGCPVDTQAYHRYHLNLPRLTAMGKAYRNGWLANVLARITPFTTYSLDDYVTMADLFVPDAHTAMALLEKMSADLNAFAAAAGVNPCAGEMGPELRVHAALYEAISKVLGAKFNMTPPAAFACTTLGKARQADMAFVRDFIRHADYQADRPRRQWEQEDPFF